MKVQTRIKLKNAIIIYLVSFILAGLFDFIIVNSLTFLNYEYNYENFNFFAFNIYQTILISCGIIIIHFGLRRKLIDQLTLPAWLSGMDFVSLMTEQVIIPHQHINWRAELYDGTIGILGESYLHILIGYWISFGLLGIYIIYFLKTSR